MRARRAFTLAELLAVIGIMMVLMVGTFGVLAMVGKQMGPDNAVNVVQSMCNAARDYAVTNGVRTRIEFYRATEGTPRTLMALRYLLPGPGRSWTTESDRRPVIGQVDVPLTDRMLILNGAPSGLPANPAAADYRNQMLSSLTNYAKTQTAAFCLYFDEQGAVDTGPSDSVQGVMTIVDVAADGQVIEYAFYPLNVNTGTRLVFE